MGFGSYDESEQKDNDVDADDSEGVAVHENDHDGSVSFETEATTSDLVDKLGDMKDEDEE
ncbi:MULTISPECIES: DUF5786 family protein [Haloarcula]|jgi:hypothetical protein|uniref:Death domain-associated protein n=10 Tax=Haloarcula TaxID=2237 RepID=Q5V2K8_HALMA|nr:MULTISPECIES: DUF5786 family protein [Haloarcula]AAV46244.1 unknown [Haloarcula marismortui ATCC 43049]AEM57499.1 conserved hypothetical protein [Haloarcula hispanica ATCC 33960]AHB66263.1 death domain-associated protein [Haloarcula hispanica N601]AJF24573.1 death domain-associated protein [Haloarcula sp. CBA1115]EMA09083.1 hypothetical protein C437_07218 [Haloarcula vallismortis ATCC 29715]